MHKARCSIEEMPCFSRSSIKFQGHTGWFIDDLNPIWVRLLGRSQLSNSSDLSCSRPSVKFQGHTGQKLANFDLYWAFPDCNSSLSSSMALKWCAKLEATQNWCPIIFRGHPSITQISRSLGTKNCQFRPEWVFPARIHWWEWNDATNLIWYKRGALLFFEVIHQISRSHGLKNRQYESYLSNVIRPVAAIKSLRFVLLYFLLLTSRIASTWHYLAWYCKWAILVNTFMFVRDIISVRWGR